MAGGAVLVSIVTNDREKAVGCSFGDHSQLICLTDDHTLSLALKVKGQLPD